MKTRTLIIIGIIIAVTIFIASISLVYNQEIKLSTGMMQTDSEPSDQYPEFRDYENYCGEWCDQNELYSMGCEQPILAHLAKYSNLLDEEFGGVFHLDFIGLPEGVTQEKFEECVDFILEKRILELYKDTPEVIAFYAKYDDAQVSLRDDHVSYFAGNEDDFRVRMNLEFDENYEIENMEFHCYVEREHQTEVPQTFILRYLKDWTCNEYGSQRNEN